MELDGARYWRRAPGHRMRRIATERKRDVTDETVVTPGGDPGKLDFSLDPGVHTAWIGAV